VGPISIVHKIEGMVHHQQPLKERIAHAIFRLSAQQSKLEHTSSKLRQRDQELFQRCIGAQVSKDSAHAKIYANECAEIRKIAKVVLSSQLAIERAVLRLQTVEEFGDVLVQIAPVIDVVKETKSQIAGVVPEVGNELEEVNSMLSDMSLETGEPEDPAFENTVNNEEARRVLQESSAIAEEKVKEQFPKIPEFDQIPNKLILIPDGGEGIPLEDAIFAYVKDHNCEFSLSDCASSLGVSDDDIKKSIVKLRDEGRIALD
jgi:division protein CdvB (Snf7/Vps24/ESCRT-III family)